MRSTLLLCLCSLASSLPAQAPPSTIPAGQALSTALTLASLSRSPAPFHAVMQVAGPTPAYAGSVDLLWASPQQYRLSLRSPQFTEARIVSDGEVSEQDTGDYFPRWLQTFAAALTDLPSLTANFADANASVATGNEHLQSCLKRDNRPGGITDQMTWGNLCFAGSQPLLQSILTFNVSLTLTDYEPFGEQLIPRTYSTDVLDYRTVTGRLTTLEKVPSDPAQFAIDKSTPPDEQIQSTFISTPQAQALFESAPTITWPTVREGRTDGFMIIYARTDRTGQVRETAKHNSDQPGLEDFGMEQALRYKFKPLLIDGVPQQMEMPLVLHFTTTLADALPVLTDAQMRGQISGCSVPKPKAGKPTYRVRISINEAGKLTGTSFPDANTAGYQQPRTFPGPMLMSCRFAPFLVDGKPTYYHGDLLLPLS